MKLEFSRQIFETASNIKFHWNQSIGCQVLCGQTDERSDMTKLIVAFLNCGNAPKKPSSFIFTFCKLTGNCDLKF